MTRGREAAGEPRPRAALWLPVWACAVLAASFHALRGLERTERTLSERARRERALLDLAGILRREAGTRRRRGGGLEAPLPVVAEVAGRRGWTIRADGRDRLELDGPVPGGVIVQAGRAATGGWVLTLARPSPSGGATAELSFLWWPGGRP